LDKQVPPWTKTRGPIQAPHTADGSLSRRAAWLSPGARAGKDAFPEIAANNFIDKHVLAKLRRLNIPPAALADDLTFLRRVYLDGRGNCPRPSHSGIHGDKQTDKRAGKIDELLANWLRPLWTLKFCDILSANDYASTPTPEPDQTRRFQQWSAPPGGEHALTTSSRSAS